MLVLAAALACNKDDGTPPPVDTETGTPAPTGDTGPTEPPPGPELVVAPENVYTLDASWTIPAVEVRAEWDLVIRWVDVTTDAWGDPVVPAEVDRVVLLETIVPDDELAARLAADDLGFDLLSTWQDDVTGSSYTQVDDLTAGKTPFVADNFLLEEASKTWVLGLAEDRGTRSELRALMIIVPTTNSQATSVAFADGASAFTWSAAFAGPALETSAGLAPDYVVDWSAIDIDVHGKEYDRALGDELFVGRFDELPDGVAAAMRDPAVAAEGWWTMDVAGEDEARLELARDAQGGAFAGFTAGSTWVVGVRCTTCTSPFPLWATVVEVR